VFSDDPKIGSPICLADHQLALEMLSALPKDRRLPQHTLDACLVNAARRGSLELVDRWLKRGASLRPASPPGAEDEYIPQLDRPLTAALQGGSRAVVQRLLDAHAPIDPAQDGDRNLVTYAIERCLAQGADKIAILKMLLAAGADPNLETEADRPALFAVNFEPELVSLLVAGGAQVNKRDKGGNTPLWYTTNIKALRALLNAGADPTLRNSQGKTAAEQFRTGGLKEQADLLDAAIAARLGPAGAEPSASSLGRNDKLH
jgi:ankyrin repeat protein